MELARAFPVSIKGVLLEGDRAVLLENERLEWELPGGRLERGESPPTCLAREFAEELDMQVAIGAILDSWVYEVMPQREVLIVTYGVRRLNGRAMRVSGEHRRFGLLRSVNLMPCRCRRVIAVRSAPGRRNAAAE